MANTIRDVLADVETKIEALTPATGDKFVVFDKTRAGDGEDAVPQNIAHRSVRVRVLSSEIISHMGTSVVWACSVVCELHHVWRRANDFEAEIIRVEDCQQIAEAIHRQRPGSSDGARAWVFDGDISPTEVGQATITALSFQVEIAVNSAV